MKRVRQRLQWVAAVLGCGLCGPALHAQSELKPGQRYAVVMVKDIQEKLSFRIVPESDVTKIYKEMQKKYEEAKAAYKDLPYQERKYAKKPSHIKVQIRKKRIRTYEEALKYVKKYARNIPRSKLAEGAIPGEGGSGTE